MGKASRAKRERREADAAQRVRAERFVAKVTGGRDTTRAEAKDQSVPERRAVFPTPPSKGSWGGKREGAGRHRIYATGAERQAAYRARLKERTEHEARGPAGS